MLPMVIDKLMMNLYACCKCGHQWTNWDDVSKEEGRIPLNCPKCRNVRWNQHYTNEEVALFEQLEDQHVIRKDAKVSKILSWEDRRVDLDFIAYEFLYKMIPHPDMFEIKKVLAIPKKNLEARHDLMLSIIRDRITNIEKYANERFSKFGGWWFDNSSKWPDPTRRYSIKTKTMNGCKHKEEPGIKEAFASSNKRDTPKYLRPVISAEILQTLDQS